MAASKRITAPNFAHVFGKDFADKIEAVAQETTKPKIGMAEAERLERQRQAKRKADEAEAKRLAEEAAEDEERRYPDK